MLSFIFESKNTFCFLADILKSVFFLERFNLDSFSRISFSEMQPPDLILESLPGGGSARLRHGWRKGVEKIVGQAVGARRASSGAGLLVAPSCETPTLSACPFIPLPLTPCGRNWEVSFPHPASVRVPRANSSVLRGAGNLGDGAPYVFSTHIRSDEYAQSALEQLRLPPYVAKSVAIVAESLAYLGNQFFASLGEESVRLARE